MHGLLPAATVVSAPQFPQNFVVTGFIVPHFGHGRPWGCCWAIMPGTCEAIPYPRPMPAPRPMPVPAPPDGFAAAAFIESARANCWYAAAFVRPSTFADAILSSASLIVSGSGMFNPLIWMISIPSVAKCGFELASVPCSMSLRLAAKSTTFSPLAFILPKVTLSCLTISSLMRSSTPDEPVDERLRVLQAVPEVSERAELHHVEVRVLEQERVLRPELPVKDPLLEVVHLGLLDDAGQGLDEFSQDGDVLRRERVPVRSVQVCEDLAVAVEDRDLVLPDDDVVVHPDVARDLPHDVLSLELVVPGDRHRADEAFFLALRLVRPPRAAEEE